MHGQHSAQPTKKAQTTERAKHTAQYIRNALRARSRSRSRSKPFFFLKKKEAKKTLIFGIITQVRV